MSEKYECPRCGGSIPNDENPGAYPGALSRFDNETEICTACGVDEALMDLAGIPLTRPSPWTYYGNEKPEWWDDETEPRCDVCGCHMEDDPEWPLSGDGSCSTCTEARRRIGETHVVA